MACVVHYENHTVKNEQSLSLGKNEYHRLMEAVACRFDLGGGNIHELQSSQIPNKYGK